MIAKIDIATPARSHFISGLKSRVLKLTFLARVLAKALNLLFFHHVVLPLEIIEFFPICLGFDLLNVLNRFYL